MEIDDFLEEQSLIRSIVALIAALLVLSSASSAQDFHRITVMAFNVENLFDTEDDSASAADDTYLPIAVKQADPNHAARCRANNDIAFYAEQCITLDWSEAVLDQKLAALAGVITAAAPFPDIVVLPETENPSIIARLNETLPPERRFQTLVQLDSTSVTNDRGIDVAIASRLPLGAAATAHPVDFGEETELCRGTRDIIEAPLLLPDGQILHVFGVHLPSGGNPFICREHALRTLNQLRRALPPDALAIAGGDFNLSCSETQGDLFARMVSFGKWGVPPEVTSGCVEPGSNKYRERSFGNWFTWSFLDFFLVSENMLAEQRSNSGWLANLGSFRTEMVSKEQLEVSGEGFVSIKRFDPVTGTGVSDHLPVMIELVTRQ